MQKKTIFISSVQKEFESERQSLKAKLQSNPILNKFFDIFLFEDTPARDKNTMDICLNKIAECDIYIGLIGNQYGALDISGISVTEREFEEATKLKKERLIFVKGTNDSERDEKELLFLKKISPQLIRRRFSDSSELYDAVYDSLAEYLSCIGAISTLPFDATPCTDATIDDIDSEKVSWFLSRSKEERKYTLSEETPIHETLKRLHLFTPNNKPTNAAILLFGKDPQQYFPTSEVKCLHYHGKVPEKPIPSYQIFHGNIFDMADGAVDFVLSKLNREVGDRSGANAVNVSYEIPPSAVREAIINAIAHRDYNSLGSVQITLFSDRLVVSSPGKLNSGLTVNDLTKLHESFPNNPKIAEPLFLAHYIEKAGTGTTDIITSCKLFGLPTPAFEVEQHVFRVIIYRKPAHGEINGEINGEIKLTQKQMEVLQLIKANKGKNLSYLSKLYKSGTPTALRNHIAALKNKGVVKFEGANKTGGYFAVN